MTFWVLVTHASSTASCAEKQQNTVQPSFLFLFIRRRHLNPPISQLLSVCQLMIGIIAPEVIKDQLIFPKLHKSALLDFSRSNYTLPCMWSTRTTNNGVRQSNDAFEFVKIVATGGHKRLNTCSRLPHCGFAHRLAYRQ